MRLKTRVMGAVSALALTGGLVAVAAPTASAAPTVIGNCGGSVSLGTILGNGPQGGLGDQTGDALASTKLLKAVTGLKPILGGSCNTNPAFANGNSTTTPKAETAKLAGRASCANGPTAQGADATAATQYPLNGKLSLTMTQTGVDTKPLSIQTYIALLGAQVANNPNGDTFNLGGIVTKGVGVGATVTGSIWQDPVVKLTGKYRQATVGTTNGSTTVTSPVGAAKFVAADVGGTITGTGIPAGAVITAVASLTSATISAAATATGAPTASLNAGNYDTGYLFSAAGAIGCADGTPGNANIGTVLVGGGGVSTVSILGGQGQGLIFSFGQ